MNQIHYLTLARFTYSIGYHILLPTLAILLLYPPFHFSMTQVSIAMAILGLADRGLALFCAPLLAYFDCRQIQIIGFLTAGLSTLSLFLIHKYSFVILLLLLSGLGYSMAGIGYRSFLSAIKDNQIQLRGFSNTYIGLNAGAALGFVVVFALPFREMGRLIYLGAGSFILVAAAFIFFGLKRQSVVPERLSLTKLFEQIKSGEWRQYHLKKAWYYVLLNFLAMFLYSQFFELVPLYFERSVGVPSYFGSVLALSTLMVVFFQYPITTLFHCLQKRWLDSSFVLGFLLFGFGSLLFALWWKAWISWIAVVIFTLAEMIALPHIDYLIGQVTPRAIQPYFFGFSITAAALGRSLCAVIGIQFLNGGQKLELGIASWWLLTAILAFVITLFITVGFLKQRFFAKQNIVGEVIRDQGL